MALINYSRSFDQPDILYLPIGGDFIQILEGSHTYPDDKVILLSKTVNPVIRNMIETGIILIKIDNSNPVIVENFGYKFAPLELNDGLGAQQPTNKIESVEVIKTNTPELITAPKPVNKKIK
jgi:hypothetical protein